ncbi:hypothetical protein H2198_009428 [Neophaeococcomyces mojaviensis]|uniref:Uncharacterized protein n=1 Tax=Neophaeococcomyces mojaviensis TaxID=3383035 RepID=A0ACC2ZUF3_9EURO|nr:hypothetical protein H2198_009428 [Knufia sp. JES_112]
MADRARREGQSTSLLTSFIRWLQLKKYQYEVTFSLYMLTPTEKMVFNSILFILISFLVTAAFFYLPDHLFIIYARVWYYISGEFTHANTSASGMMDILKTAKDVVTSSGGVGKAGVVSQSVAEKIVKETIGVVRGEL